MVTCSSQTEQSVEFDQVRRKDTSTQSEGIFDSVSSKGLHLQGSHRFGNELENNNSFLKEKYVFLLFLIKCMGKSIQSNL